ncbi:hypothetical protein [Sphingomonas sp. 3-13AW]|uniref:hypothetical protein n=1 Tax=Sphingomonas sp. 3-13AW TaxID=3050450 RepID=UPI003BB553F9
MNRLTVITVICCLVVAAAAGSACAALNAAELPGGQLYSFVAGLLAIAAGGTGTMVPLAWVLDHFSGAGRQPCSGY